MAKNVNWLIICLGNPESQYAWNRHNIGWMVAAELCSKHKKPLMKIFSKSYHASLRIAGQLALVILPTTYMNASGEAVSEVIESYDIPAERIIVVCDEYNFPLGKIHVRQGGSDGGHNGVASVIEELGTEEFFRLRCGIGKNFPQGGMVDYVLSDFLDDEIEEKNIMVKKAVDSIEYLIQHGKTKTMTDVNSEKLWDKDNKAKKENGKES
ncbi:MAG: aminoacyl-tRNA hydrolase [Ignavibacteria bacterium GWB2_35_12]|nr:MAG: aminoacyl-tRNA hydrolase [Ignavibacteria bacterium GWB2_35_12]OGU95883.1 MAG: aminoacyl-tRNA hydrolase [Ignavibacteria bacterium RIFOXYA2_FULL_35_10]OGV20651.1 MAG: aminoacyl-tRNA hydrolase [Ignavibacteria bacterium RIFOXYC2_FULL_35_21]